MKNKIFKIVRFISLLFIASLAVSACRDSEPPTAAKPPVAAPAKKTRWVTAINGLPLSREPSATAEKIITLLNGAELEVLETQEADQTINGMTGKWTRAVFATNPPKTGWVFGGFLVDKAPEPGPRDAAGCLVLDDAGFSQRFIRGVIGDKKGPYLHFNNGGILALKISPAAAEVTGGLWQKQGKIVLFDGEYQEDFCAAQRSANPPDEKEIKKCLEDAKQKYGVPAATHKIQGALKRQADGTLRVASYTNMTIMPPMGMPDETGKPAGCARWNFD